MTDTIRYTREGHVGQILLNDPKRHNSLGQEQLESIQHYLAAVAGDAQVRVLVLTGAGDKTFCAGASLQQLGAGELSGDAFSEATAQLADLAIPTICALNGNVFGAGVELALSCDFRIGMEGTRMRVPAAAIGICYPPSGVQRLVQGLGLHVARRMLLAAEEFDARAMYELGFLDHLVLPGKLVSATHEKAQELACLAPLAVRSMKGILAQVASGSIDETRARELGAMCAGSSDLREGLAALKEKRQPRFSGS